MEEKKSTNLNALKGAEQKSYAEGIQAFQLNCIRQGIELEHDPDKPLKPDDAQFNKVVVMERIKSNIKKHDTDKKERVKRENRKKIDADQAKTKSDTIWS